MDPTEPCLVWLYVATLWSFALPISTIGVFKARLAQHKHLSQCLSLGSVLASEAVAAVVYNTVQALLSSAALLPKDHREMLRRHRYEIGKTE